MARVEAGEERGAADSLPRRRLDRQVIRLERRLPDCLAKKLRRLRHPSSTWLRRPVGALLVLGGLFSFLPVLGIWMLPLGLVLLAYDTPLLAPAVGRVLVKGAWRWRKWRRSRSR